MYLQEKDIEQPYRGLYERSWRDFDNDDVLLLGAVVGAVAAVGYSRRWGIMGWPGWVGAMSMGAGTGFAIRRNYCFLSVPAGWSAWSEREVARRREAAKWTRDVEKTIEAREQRERWERALTLRVGLAKPKFEDIVKRKPSMKDKAHLWVNGFQAKKHGGGWKVWRKR